MSHIVIYGAGKTGKFLQKMLKNDKILLYDDNPAKSEVSLSALENLDVSKVILSPGVPPDAPLLRFAKRRKIPISCEFDECFAVCRAKIISATGTNGKTTLTQMLHTILIEQNFPSHLLGNGGVPFSSEAAVLSPQDVAVLESSSFQLDRCKIFAPAISIFTSLAPDHLDYHGSYDSYVAAKCNNFLRQKKDGYAIFNADDAECVCLSAQCPCRTLFYGSGGNCFYKEGKAVLSLPQNETVSIFSETLGKFPSHILSDALGALLAASLCGCDFPRAVATLENFTPDRHRMEFVCRAKGVTFVDDSKATNPHATIAALCATQGNIALILGGSDKMCDFSTIFDNFCNVVYAAAIGQTADKIIASARRKGITVRKFDSLEQAVFAAARAIFPMGGTVLFSPACASFDCYDGYASRGNAFIEAAKKAADSL